MKIPDCDRCLLYSHQLDHVCVLHPFGVYEDYCLDFRSFPDIQDEEETSHEELWIKENYTWYGDKLIHNHPSRYTFEEQLQILDTHPFFTGICLQCGHKFETSPPPQTPWHCLRCDWMEESVQ